MNRQTALGSAVILFLFAAFGALIALTNPGAVSLAMATLLIGVALIAIASYAGL